MFAIPGLILLVVVDFFKPQEYVPILAGVPLLYMFTGLALVGFLVDLRLGLSDLVPAPQLVCALLFLGWCIVTDVPRGAGVAARQTYALLIPFSLFLLLAHGVQSFRALESMVGVVLAIGLTLALIGAHQGVAPWGCHRLTYTQGAIKAMYDGRTCSAGDTSSCQDGSAEPGVDYACERVGLFGSQSVAGRVRFRGTLEDPNELSLATSAVIPLAFGFLGRRRSVLRILLLGVTIVLAGVCAVFTRSRGGQLVFLTALGVYFVSRFGKRGAILGLLGALPVLVLGGRSTGEAEGSTIERLECWARGMQMLRESPLLGVGLGQFTENHYLTAHNSLVLTAAELGIPGMVLWSALVYLSLRIPYEALRRGGGGERAVPPVARTWALAVLALLTSVVVGAFLLSYAYKETLWIFLGLSAALYQSIRRHDPSFRVRLGAKDLGVIVAADAVLLLGVTILTRYKLGHW